MFLRRTTVRLDETRFDVARHEFNSSPSLTWVGVRGLKPTMVELVSRVNDDYLVDMMARFR